MTVFKTNLSVQINYVTILFACVRIICKRIFHFTWDIKKTWFLKDSLADENRCSHNLLLMFKNIKVVVPCWIRSIRRMFHRLFECSTTWLLDEVCDSWRLDDDCLFPYITKKLLSFIHNYLFYVSLKALLPHDYFFWNKGRNIISKCFKRKQVLFDVVQHEIPLQSTTIWFPIPTHRFMIRHLFQYYTSFEAPPLYCLKICLINRHKHLIEFKPFSRLNDLAIFYICWWN